MRLESEATVILPEIPQPELAISEELILNRRTGLLEHLVTVTNAGSRAIGGFALTVSDLHGGTVYNFSQEVAAGEWLIQHDSPVDAGDSVDLTLEYFLASRQAPEAPVIAVEHPLPLPSQPLTTESAFAIDRIIPLEGSAIAIEFETAPGECYLVQYSFDGEVGTIPLS